MLDAIKSKMEATLKREGVAAEVTFISSVMFSVLCDTADQFAKAKQIMSAARAKFDSEDCDDECGYCAYYAF